MCMYTQVYITTPYVEEMYSSVFHIFFFLYYFNISQQHCIAYMLIALIKYAINNALIVFVCVFIFILIIIFIFYFFALYRCVHLNINGYLVNLFFQVNNLLALIITIHK